MYQLILQMMLMCSSEQLNPVADLQFCNLKVPRSNLGFARISFRPFFSIIFIQKQYFLQVNSLLMPLKHTCTFCSLASLFKYLLRLVLALFIFHNICTRWKIYFSLNVRFQFQIHAPMKCLAQNKNYMQLNRSESLKALDFSEQCNSHHHHHVAPLTPFAKLLSKL